MKKLLLLLRNNLKVQASVLIGITFVVYASLINNLNLWVDEIYSVLMAKDSFSDMWVLLTTEDSKPPFYYVYLKFILMLFPKAYEIWAAHFSSFILLIAAQIFVAIAVRRDYGDKVALWIMALIVLLAPSLWLAFEVRAYMLANLLLLMTLIYGCRTINKPKNSDYFYFGLTSLLALYSHYYCAIWLMFFYIGIFYFHLKENLDLKKFILTSLVVAILFAPWLYIPLKTASQISSMWYVTRDFVNFSWQFFTNPLAPEIFQSVFFIATTFSFSVFNFILLLGLVEHSNKKYVRSVYLALYSFICSYLLLLILSYAFRPMVSARYLKTFALILYFAGGIILTWFKNLNKTFLGIALIGFVFTYVDIRAVSFDKEYQKAAQDIRRNLSPQNPLLVLDNGHLFCEYYLPEYTCLLITDANGEILRHHKVMEKIPLYDQVTEPIVYFISIFDLPREKDTCQEYKSIYRAGQTISVCRGTLSKVYPLLERSFGALIGRFKTP